MNPSRLRLVRHVRARPRLFFSTVVALLVGFGLPDGVVVHPVTRVLIAWNAGTWLYIVLATLMMSRSSEHHMRHRAQMQDEGRLAVLGFVVVSAVASVVAIAGQLSVAHDLHGTWKAAHIGLAGATVVSSWAFTQIMFALHYAHDYYAAVCRNEPAGLRFPDDDRPTYGDFFHFAAIIGTSGQTADVSFASKAMRRTGTVHCILAYLFNTTVVAMLINIGAGLV